MEDSKASVGNVQTYLKEQNIELTFDRIVIQAVSGMAQGFLASLLTGTIIGTTEKFISGSVGEFCKGISGYAGRMQGAVMAMAIGYALQYPPYVLFSLITVGPAINALGGVGGLLVVYFASLIAVFFGELVSKRTAVDLLVTPTVTITVGVMVASFLVLPIGADAPAVGYMVMWATEQQSLLMRVPVTTIVGITLTLPISSAAICTALSPVGPAGGAAATGCCAQVMGLAVCSYRENHVSGLSPIRLGAAILMLPNTLKKPVLWLPPLITGVTTDPVATCVFRLKVNGTPISSGVGAYRLMSPIGVMTGWFSPGQAVALINETAISPALKDWIGLALICLTLPTLLSFAISELVRREGWIQQGDYTPM